MTKQTILDYLSKNQYLFAKKFGVVKMGLFGSYAKNQATKDSDIDIIIEMNPKSITKRLELKQELENHFQKSVDIGYLSSLRNFISNSIKKDIIYV